MKRLIALTVGIMIILSLTLAAPAMAGKPPTTGKPVVSAPHYDVNFITGEVDVLAAPIYQIKVSDSGVSTINVVADTAFAITDWDATADNGTVTVPSAATYTVYAQFRSNGKPNSSANLTLVGVDTWEFPTSTRNEWVLISDSVCAGDTILFANNGCANFATRWLQNESEEPVVLFEEDFSSVTGTLPEGWSSNRTNWHVQTTSNAGGGTNELHFSWTPEFIDTSRVVTPPIDASGYSSLEITFKHMVDDYDGFFYPYDLRIQVTTDGGNNWADAWSISPIDNVGPETVTVDLSAYDGQTFQLAWVFIGDSYDINHWYIDDIVLTGS